MWRRFSKLYRRRWKQDPRYVGRRDARVIERSLELYAWQVAFLLDEIEEAFQDEDPPVSFAAFVRRIDSRRVA